MATITPDIQGSSLAAPETAGLWLGDDDRPALGWLTRRPGDRMDSAIVVAPALGYAYWCGHRPLRLLAERLAENGHAVLRVDYDGTGDSAGDQWDPGRVTAWRETVARAVEEMRRLGAGHVTLIGARLGATFALLDARALGAERVVAWLPLAQGRRYAREIRLLSTQVPKDQDPAADRPTRLVAGSVFTDETVRDIANLTLTDLDAPPAPSVLVIDDLAGSSADAVDRLRAVGTDVEHRAVEDSDEVLETPPEYAFPAETVLTSIAEWIGAADSSDVGGPAPPVPTRRASLSWRGERLYEEVVRLGPEGRVAILTSPERADPTAATFVLLNSGSESHVGPGRAWVEYARDLALAGRRTVRVDFLGWGESPDVGRAPGKPYDPACVAEVHAIVDALRAAGHERVVVGGLCAAAWIALDAARDLDAAGVIAINAQLYWQQGDPVEIDWDLIRLSRTAEIRRIRWGQRLGLWTALDALGRRARAGRWLDQLSAGETRIELLFSERDDGLMFLEQRFGRRLSRLQATGTIGFEVVPEIDHPMHMTWLRPRMLSSLRSALERIDRTAVRGGSGAAQHPAGA